jgi:hypothetical protein
MDKNNENNHLNSEPNNFGLPAGYFQNSANSIVNKIEWVEEHKNFPALEKLKKQSGFIIPNDYFVNNENKLELIEFPKLSALNKINAFKTPANYFNELEEKQFVHFFNENDLEILGEKLSTIPKQANFKVKKNYFDSSAEKISNSLLNQKKGGKLIKLFSPKIYYAAAAILTITLGLWFYNHYFLVAETKDCGTLACVDKADLLKTKNLENLDNDQLYELVDTKKLEEKLENKTNNTTKNEDIDTSLNNVSVDDLLDEI